MYEALKALRMTHALTVRNTYQQGYERATDIGPFSPSEIIEQAINCVKHHGYKIGSPRYLWPEKGIEQDRGLYKLVQQPIKEQNTTKP